MRAGLKAEEEVIREQTAISRVAYEGAVAQLEARRKRMQESDDEIAGAGGALLLQQRVSSPSNQACPGAGVEGTVCSEVGGDGWATRFRPRRQASHPKVAPDPRAGHKQAASKLTRTLQELDVEVQKLEKKWVAEEKGVGGAWSWTRVWQ